MIGKLNDIRLLLLAALPAFMLGACSQEEMGSEHADSLNAQSREIRFEIGFAPQKDAAQTDAQTRVATDTQFRSTWEEGDEIGIYAVKHGEALAPSDNYVHNVKLTYRGGSWMAENDIYWPVGGTKLDFYAYHPYAAAASDPTSMAFIVDTDQSESDDTKNNYNLSDVLIAKNDNSSNGFGKGETVPLSFTHALAENECTLLQTSTSVGQRWWEKCAPQTRARSCRGMPYLIRALIDTKSLKEFIFPRNITVIGKQAFDSCTGLTSLTIPSGVTIGNYAFWHCTGLESLIISTGATIGNFAFWHCTGLTSLTILSGVTIGSCAFWNCTGLTALSLSEGIKAIGEQAFNGCTGLTGTLTIPGSLETIVSDSFNGAKFSAVYISSGIKKIGKQAFYNCRNLTTLTIPASVTDIEYGVFYNCTSLSSITCYIIDLEKVKFGPVIFGYVPKTATVYVPAAAVGAYKIHEVWSSFNILPIPTPS